jgi:hypothetical protein
METINNTNNSNFITENDELHDEINIDLQINNTSNSNFITENDELHDEINNTSNENNSKKKRVSNRYILYASERKEILNKIFEILSITDTQKDFYSHDFDENKINSIFELEDKIKMYFNTSTWAVFRPGVVKTKHLSIIKFIFKDMQVKYNTKSFKIRINKQYVNTTKYTIV